MFEEKGPSFVIDSYVFLHFCKLNIIRLYKIIVMRVYGMLGGMKLKDTGYDMCHQHRFNTQFPGLRGG